MRTKNTTEVGITRQKLPGEAGGSCKFLSLHCAPRARPMRAMGKRLQNKALVTLVNGQQMLSTNEGQEGFWSRVFSPLCFLPLVAKWWEALSLQSHHHRGYLCWGLRPMRNVFPGSMMMYKFRSRNEDHFYYQPSRHVKHVDSGSCPSLQSHKSV